MVDVLHRGLGRQGHVLVFDAKVPGDRGAWGGVTRRRVSVRFSLKGLQIFFRTRAEASYREKKKKKRRPIGFDQSHASGLDVLDLKRGRGVRQQAIAGKEGKKRTGTSQSAIEFAEGGGVGGETASLP